MGVQVNTLSERVHEILRMRIVSSEVAPGDAIRQDAVAAELGVSKIPVREALIRLVGDGLVISSPNRGFIAAPASRDEAIDIFDARELIEPPTAAFACETADDAARAAVEAAATAVTAPSDGPDARPRLDLVLALLRPAGRPTVVALAEPLFFRSARYLARVPRDGVELGMIQTLAAAYRRGQKDEVRHLYDSVLKSRRRLALNALEPPMARAG